MFQHVVKSCNGVKLQYWFNASLEKHVMEVYEDGSLMQILKSRDQIIDYLCTSDFTLPETHINNLLNNYPF